ncbi:MAG: hypothetical protein NT069_12610 [Planctomycetota bacterium]|nr:hypothetical protein [Planctomycetota bacterium]
MTYRICGVLILVRQPAFSNFQVQTTVSVPDSGGAMVGSVARSVRGGTTYNGLAPAGTRVGAATTGSSLHARVWIHDFEEMDQQVLTAAASRPKPVAGKLNRRAEGAWNQLEISQTSRAAKSTVSADSSRPVAATTGKENLAAEGARLYREGVLAEEQGRKKLALAFFRTAAKQGSPEAQRELARLESRRQPN